MIENVPVVLEHFAKKFNIFLQKFGCTFISSNKNQTLSEGRPIMYFKTMLSSSFHK